MRIVYFLIFLFFIINCYSQTNEAVDYVFRLRIKKKDVKDVVIQTGFIVNGKNGIYTALHGVTGEVEWIMASNKVTGKTFNLKLNLVDIDKDVAFLVKTDEGTRIDEGLQVRNIEVKDAQPAIVIGHPHGIVTSVNKISLGNPCKLRLTDLIISPTSIKIFNNRSSPILSTPIIKLDGPIVKGHSGAPVLDNTNKLIGIISGGLAGGLGEISWCIGFNEISLEPITKDNILGRLKVLALQPSENLFSIEVEDDNLTDENNKFSNFEQYLDMGYMDLKSTKSASINKIYGSFAVNYSILYKKRFMSGVGVSLTGLSLLSQRETLPNIYVNDTIYIDLKPRFYLNGKYYFLPLHSNRIINPYAGLFFTVPDSFHPYTGASIKMWRKTLLEIKVGYTFFNTNHKDIIFNIFGDSNYNNVKYHFTAISIIGGINFNLRYY